MNSVRVLSLSMGTVAENLALEHSIIQSKFPTLRVWKNSDTVVLGRTQDIHKEVDLYYCKENNIEVNRRISSGGAVYHDLGNLNISFFLPLKLLGREVMTAVGRLTLLLYNSLIDLGIESLAIHNLSNLTFRGAKISGSAQYVFSGYLLHHATLLVSSNLERLERSLLVKEREPSVRNSSRYYPTTNLGNLDGKSFLKSISENVSDEFGETFIGDVKEEELLRMNQLVSDVYTKDHWIMRGRLRGK